MINIIIAYNNIKQKQSPNLGENLISNSFLFFEQMINFFSKFTFYVKFSNGFAL